MQTLLPILMFSLLFSYLTERTTVGEYGTGQYQTSLNKLFFFLLLCTLALPVGLRTSYNDTWAYIKSFSNFEPVGVLVKSNAFHILRNPAFILYCSLLRSVTSNYHIFLLIPAFFVQYSFVRFIRRYSPSFTVGVGIYILLGTYVFSFAAIKQTIAMAVLLFAIPELLEKNYAKFYMLVFIAVLFHTYAIAFLVLPLFVSRPWDMRTVLFLSLMAFVMLNFETVITSFLEAADESGKTIAEYEVFDGTTINTLRVAVYAVTPAMSLFFQRYLFRSSKNKQYQLFVNMSIISVAIMSLGTISGANMFGRMAQYFEFGMICGLPWIIKKVFEPRSAKLVTGIALVLFFVYFYYAYQINMVFDDHYRAVTIFEFIISLFS